MVIKELFSSKKFVVSLVAVLAVISNSVFGRPVDEESILKIVGVLSAYVLGQGIADFGKSGAEVYAFRDMLRDDNDDE